LKGLSFLAQQFGLQKENPGWGPGLSILLCSRKVVYMVIVLRVVFRTIVLTIRWRQR
jgi:hypothetical protein